MINIGYALNIDDSTKFRELRQSDMYNLYLKSVANSPAYRILIKEHIKDINVAEDIDRLKKEGTLPESVSTTLLNDIIKKTMDRMAVNIVSDTIILRELEEVRIDKVINELTEDINTVYLLGLADKKYYEEASELRSQGKIDIDDIRTRGLIEWEKRNKIVKHDQSLVPAKKGIKKSTKNTDPAVKIVTEEPEVKLDMDSLDIRI